MKHLSLDPRKEEPPTSDDVQHPTSLPSVKETKVQLASAEGETASLFFVGTATTIP